MNNEKLIECVKEYPFLYDLNDRKYGDNQLKDKAWKKIAKKLHVHEKYCRKSWSLLRDAFRRAIKKQKETKSGQACGSARKWKYVNEMSFLLPYFKDRSTISTLPPTNEDKVSDDEENVCNDDTGGISVSPDLNISQIPPYLFSTPTPTQNLTYKNISGPSGYNSTPEPKKARIHQSAKKQSCKETPLTLLMKYILENKKANGVQQFFDSIATTVQSFPPRDQAIAKSKVFAVISEMEIEILSRGTSSANVDSRTSSEHVRSRASSENVGSCTSSELGSPPNFPVPVHIYSDTKEFGNLQETSSTNTAKVFSFI